MRHLITGVRPGTKFISAGRFVDTDEDGIAALSDDQVADLRQRGYTVECLEPLLELTETQQRIAANQKAAAEALDAAMAPLHVRKPKRG